MACMFGRVRGGASSGRHLRRVRWAGSCPPTPPSPRSSHRLAGNRTPPSHSTVSYDSRRCGRERSHRGGRMVGRGGRRRGSAERRGEPPPRDKLASARVEPGHERLARSSAIMCDAVRCRWGGAQRQRWGCALLLHTGRVIDSWRRPAVFGRPSSARIVLTTLDRGADVPRRLRLVRAVWVQLAAPRTAAIAHLLRL